MRPHPALPTSDRRNRVLCRPVPPPLLSTIASLASTGHSDRAALDNHVEMAVPPQLTERSPTGTPCAMCRSRPRNQQTAEKFVPQGPPTAPAEATTQGCAGGACSGCVVRADVNNRTRGNPLAAAISRVALEALPTLNCTATHKNRRTTGQLSWTGEGMGGERGVRRKFSITTHCCFAHHTARRAQKGRQSARLMSRPTVEDPVMPHGWYIE